MSKLKLKKLLKEHTISLAGGVVSKPAFHNRYVFIQNG